MYGGQEPSPQLDPANKQVHAILSRSRHVSRLGKAERQRCQSVHGAKLPDQHEKREKRQTACRHQQRGLVGRPRDDEKVWRPQQKHSDKGRTRTTRRRIYNPDRETLGWQSTQPLRTELLSNFGDQRQAVDSPHKNRITRLSRQLAEKYVSQYLGRHIPATGRAVHTLTNGVPDIGTLRPAIRQLESQNLGPFLKFPRPVGTAQANLKQTQVNDKARH